MTGRHPYLQKGGGKSRGGAQGQGAGPYRGLGAGNYDCFCTHCGMPVYGEAWEKPKTCPHQNCKAPMPLRDGFDENGWGCCPRCDGFTNREHKYCRKCRRGNDELLERLARQAAAKKQQENFIKTQKLNDMLSAVQEENRRLKAQAAEDAKIIEKYDEEVLARVSMEVDVGADDKTT